LRKFLGAVAILVVVLVAVVLISPFTFLPGIWETMVSGNLKDQLGLQERPKVELESDPALGILAGSFQSGTVKMSDYDFGKGVSADKVTVDLDPFDVDVAESVTGGGVKVGQPPSGSVEVELSEKDVFEIAKARVEDFPVNDVRLEKDRVLVDSEARMLGVAAPVSVAGGLKIRAEKMVFTPENVEAFGIPLPQEITDALLGGTDFEYPLTGLPEGTRITDLTVNKNRMTLFGDVESFDLG